MARPPYVGVSGYLVSRRRIHVDDADRATIMELVPGHADDENAWTEVVDLAQCLAGGWFRQEPERPNENPALTTRHPATVDPVLTQVDLERCLDEIGSLARQLSRRIKDSSLTVKDALYNARLQPTGKSLIGEEIDTLHRLLYALGLATEIAKDPQCAGYHLRPRGYQDPSLRRTIEDLVVFWERHTGSRATRSYLRSRATGTGEGGAFFLFAKAVVALAARDGSKYAPTDSALGRAIKGVLSLRYGPKGSKGAPI